MAKVLFTGIDVSNAGQGRIADWSKVAKNVDFAILKICNGYQSDKNVAQYSSSLTYGGTLDIWQYTSSGTVPGINGKVAMNRCYTSFVKGDVNNDGKVTAADARIILRCSAKLEVLSGQAAENADIDGDGDTDAADARAALRKSAGVK